jgi:MFS family permease
MDALPIGAVFAATILVVVFAIEGGYRLGRAARRRSEDEKESPVSAIAATILALLAFIMAFTFGIVSDRYDARKTLVREEANAIRTAWSRSDFLPEPDRGEAVGLLRNYVGRRLAAVQSNDRAQVRAAVVESERIQRRLWEMAVVNARKDMNSDVAALYIEALNEITNVHALRVAIGVQARLPTAVWLVLLALIVLGMIAVGYQTSIAGSRRTWAMLILALSFSLVIALIAQLDRPQSGYLRVTQQPLEDLKVWMAAGLDTR